MAVTFSEVKQILDDAIDGWKARTGRDPFLALHGDNFSWGTREELLAAEAFGFRLIDPSMIGNNMGHQTNLAIALRDPNGVASMGQMPSQGPFLDDDQISKLIQWINDGALSDTACSARITTTFDVEVTEQMGMLDPDVNKQSDLAPYPNGPGKLLNVWDVTVGFNTTVPSPIHIRVTGVEGGSGDIRPGNVFSLINANDEFQETGSVYEGEDTQGCLVLHNPNVGPTQSPPYDPAANHFPDPNERYPFRHMTSNGRWFTVSWKIVTGGGAPSLELTAKQQPRVNSVTDRVCPVM